MGGEGEGVLILLENLEIREGRKREEEKRREKGRGSEYTKATK